MAHRHPPKPSSSDTSRNSWPATRPPAGFAWSRRSAAPPTARSTTRVTGPNRSRNSSPRPECHTLWMYTAPVDATLGEAEWRPFVEANSFGHLVAAGRHRDVPVVVAPQLV